MAATSMVELASTVFSAVSKRQQLLMANLTGNGFLLFLLYAWLAAHSGEPKLNASVLVLIAVVFLGVWLVAATLAAFHPGVTETPFVPALRRLPATVPWLGALAGTAVLFVWMGHVLTVYVGVVGVAAGLALLPLLSQAAGGGFSRENAVNIIFHEQYWLLATALLVAGLYLPWLIFSWLPHPAGLVARALLTGVRLSIAYFLAVCSWVALAAVIGTLGARLEMASIEEAAKSAITPPEKGGARRASSRFTPRAGRIA